MINLRARPASKVPGRRFMVSLGLLAILGAVGLFWVGYNAPNRIPGRAYYQLKAEFRNADNIAGHQQIRNGGRLIGQVLNPRVENGRAVVDLQLDKEAGPLRSDTKLQVRPRGAIGVRYLELTPGTRGRILQEGETIRAEQTSATVQLDEVLSALDAPTRQSARTFLNQLGGGAAGHGEDLNAAFASGPRFLSDATSVAAALNARPGATAQLVRSGEQAAAAFDPVRGELAESFDNGARALRPLHEHADALRATLERAPQALVAVRSGLAQTEPLAAELEGFARAARPALEVAPEALAETTGLLRGAPPALTRADDTLRLAASVVPPTDQALRALRDVLPATDRALASALPLVSTLGAHGCDIVGFGRNWASMLGLGDGFYNALRWEPLVNQESIHGTGDDARVDTGFYSNPYPEPCESGDEELIK